MVAATPATPARGVTSPALTSQLWRHRRGQWAGHAGADLSRKPQEENLLGLVAHLRVLGVFILGQ
jgi:hypothetical protein